MWAPRVWWLVASQLGLPLVFLEVCLPSQLAGAAASQSSLWARGNQMEAQAPRIPMGCGGIKMPFPSLMQMPRPRRRQKLLYTRPMRRICSCQQPYRRQGENSLLLIAIQSNCMGVISTALQGLTASAAQLD